MQDRNAMPGAAVSNPKFKAIEAAFQAIEKQFGKGSIMRMHEATTTSDIAVLPTGALSLDIALGIGGLPKGRVVEIYGSEASGKTTLALHVIAQCQKAGGVAAFIDAEHALDVSYARRIGVNTSDLLLSQPDYGEQALEIVDMLVRSQAVDIIVIDSVAALVPKAEIEGEMGDSHVGLHARLMSQALRKLTGSIARSHCVVVFINQVRMKIGVMFGNPETTTGGQALKFYSSVRLEVRRSTAIKTANETVGNRTKVKVVKNKVAPPFRECEFDVMFGTGISREGDVLDLATESEILQKSGVWFTYGNERLGQGRENAKEYLREHPETLDRLEKEVRAAAKLANAQREAARDGALANSSLEGAKAAALPPGGEAASTQNSVSAPLVSASRGPGRPPKGATSNAEA